MGIAMILVPAFWAPKEFHHARSTQDTPVLDTIAAMTAVSVARGFVSVFLGRVDALRRRHGSLFRGGCRRSTPARGCVLQQVSHSS